MVAVYKPGETIRIGRQRNGVRLAGGGGCSGVPYSKIDGTVSLNATFVHLANGVIAWTQTTVPTAQNMQMQFRKFDATNFYRVQINAADKGLVLYKYVANVPTLCGTSVLSVADGNRIVVAFTGASIRVYIDNVLSIDYASATEFQASTDGKYSFNNGGVVSSLKTWDYACLSQEVTPRVITPLWQRMGTVMVATLPAEDSNVQEPTVIYEGNAQILSGDVFKMWYSAEWETATLNYAESADGITWTKYSGNPIVAGHNRSYMLKDGATYYLYGANAANTQIDLYTSSDGVTFSLDTSAVIGLGAGGTWDDVHVANLVVWKEGASDWRMLYEADDGGWWRIGYATSSDGKSWSKSGSNPVVNGSASRGGPGIYKANNGTYWLWVHGAPVGYGEKLPTDLYRYYSSNLTSWVASPVTDKPLFVRRTSDEGINTTIGQVADPCYLEHNGQVYLWYSASTDGNTKAAGQHINLAIFDGTFEDLILTNEDYGLIV